MTTRFPFIYKIDYALKRPPNLRFSLSLFGFNLLSFPFLEVWFSVDIRITYLRKSQRNGCARGWFCHLKGATIYLYGRSPEQKIRTQCRTYSIPTIQRTTFLPKLLFFLRKSPEGLILETPCRASQEGQCRLTLPLFFTAMPQRHISIPLLPLLRTTSSISCMSFFPSPPLPLIASHRLPAFSSIPD